MAFNIRVMGLKCVNHTTFTLITALFYFLLCHNKSTDDNGGSRIMAGQAYVPKHAQTERSTTDTSVESEIEGIEKEDLPSQPPPAKEYRKEGK